MRREELDRQGPPPHNENLAEIEQMADKEIRQAEAMKAHLNTIRGNEVNKRISSKLAHSMFVDEDYAVMGGHVDNSTKMKIINSKYVDFARLLPHDRLYEVDDKQMELVNRNGHSYWVLVEHDVSNVISNFNKWEQSFKVFSMIYTERYPNRATELIQYNYIISSASTSLTWENVYAYDRDFRLHISRHPDRSLGGDFTTGLVHEAKG